MRWTVPRRLSASRAQIPPVTRELYGPIEVHVTDDEALVICSSCLDFLGFAIGDQEGAEDAADFGVWHMRNCLKSRSSLWERSRTDSEELP